MNSSTIRHRSALAFLLLAAASGAASAPPRTDPDVPPQESVEGVAQSEWVRAWAQWVGSFDKGASPVTDPSGALCDRGQRGPVWFLAGTPGNRRTLRHCRIPRNKYLFVPVVAQISVPDRGADFTCARVTQSAAAFTDDPTALVLELDGVIVDGIAAHRQATTTCFDMGAQSESKVAVYPSAANGYFVMLKPLSPGRHVLGFGGALPALLQAVTYTLDVE